jgi:hypothetical protein
MHSLLPFNYQYYPQKASSSADRRAPILLPFVFTFGITFT